MTEKLAAILEVRQLRCSFVLPKSTFPVPHCSESGYPWLRLTIARPKISIGEVPVPKKTVFVTRQANAKSDGVGDVNTGPLDR